MKATISSMGVLGVILLTGCVGEKDGLPDTEGPVFSVTMGEGPYHTLPNSLSDSLPGRCATLAGSAPNLYADFTFVLSDGNGMRKLDITVENGGVVRSSIVVEPVESDIRWSFSEGLPTDTVVEDTINVNFSMLGQQVRKGVVVSFRIQSHFLNGVKVSASAEDTFFNTSVFEPFGLYTELASSQCGYGPW